MIVNRTPMIIIQYAVSILPNKNDANNVPSILNTFLNKLYAANIFVSIFSLEKFLRYLSIIVWNIPQQKLYVNIAKITNNNKTNDFSAPIPKIPAIITLIESIIAIVIKLLFLNLL